MARRLTMRQQWILFYLRDNPGASMKEIADDSPIDLVQTEEWAQRHPRMTVEIRSLNYSTVNYAMKSLLDRGLVRREGSGEMWKPFRHYVIAEPEYDDPLEHVFALDITNP